MEQIAVVIVLITGCRHSELFEVVDTGACLRLLSRLVQRRQEHAGKDCDDRNHNEQLDQSEFFLSEDLFLFLSVIFFIF